MQKNEIQTALLNLQENLGSVLSHTGEAITQAHTADIEMQKSHLAALGSLKQQIELERRLFNQEIERLREATQERFNGLLETIDALISYQQGLVDQMEKL